MPDKEDLVDTAMLIVANAGAGRSLAYEALASAKRGDLAAADAKLAESDSYIHAAQGTHLKILQMAAKGEIENETVFMAHADDHLMCAVLANELIKEFVELYRSKTVSEDGKAVM